MKVVVCVKQVRVLGDEVGFTADGRDVDPDYLDQALNEWDACATEEALRIRESPGLVLCGVQSSDSVQGSTGTALAELLGLPRVAVVTRIEWGGSGPATVHRELEGGLIDIVEVDTPALLTVQTGINQPRYAT